MSVENRKPQIFISYSRRDLDFVKQLAADLGAAGLDGTGNPQERV